LLNRNPPKATSCDASDPSIAARKVNRSYDARNRLTALTFPDGRGNQVWSYEKDGLPASVITYNGSGSTEPVVTITTTSGVCSAIACARWWARSITVTTATADA
jgi:hypothetical protein